MEGLGGGSASEATGPGWRERVRGDGAWVAGARPRRRGPAIECPNRPKWLYPCSSVTRRPGVQQGRESSEPVRVDEAQGVGNDGDRFPG